MAKKSVFLLLLMLLMVASVGYAANMQVTSSVSPVSGGTITPNGIKFSSTEVNYTVAPNSGWTLTSVLIDGVAATGLQVVDATHFKVAFDTSKIHTIKANFAQVLYSITTSAGAGGTIQVTGGGNVNITPGSSRTVVVAPNTGYRIASLTVNGSSVPVAAPTVANTVSFGNIQSNNNVNATFSVIPTATVYAGDNKTVSGASTGLIGSVSSISPPTAYLWLVNSGPAGSSFINGTTLTPTFMFSALGTYTVTLRATVGGTNFISSPASITVTSAPAEISIGCTTCHAGQAQITDWLASKHASSPAGASCVSCHMPNAEIHPGQVMVTTANTVCNACHTQDPQGNVANHPLEIGTNTCYSCHNPHSLAASGGAAGMTAAHFNNITSGMYPASYMTSQATCANCHVAGSAGPANKTIRQQWAASGHAATTALPWIDYDFKTRVDGCVRCHTTTGFIAYSTAKVTAAWGTASDKTKEVLTCVGCHSNVANGVVRTVTPNKPFADEVTFTNADVSTSNICMDCHSGRNNGTSIQVKADAHADFNNLAYVAPHYLTAGGSLQGKSGFSFPGRSYTSYADNAHSKVGTADNNSTGTDGPCVACHMATTPAKHSFTPVTTDATGAITAITATVCVNCHTTTLPASTLDTKRVAFNNALDVLKAALLDKGFAYSANYPYFAAKNWGSGQSGANVMGAAFNYKLFAAEPGAYAHNPEYAKQLIADSIEAVFTGGSVTGSDISSYLNVLVASNKLTADQVSSLNTFKVPTNSCSDCHSFPPASPSHASANTSSLNCSNCHIYTGMGGATHNNGAVDFIPGGLTCTSCHPNLSGSHTAHVGNLPSLVTAYGGTDTNFLNNNTDSTGYKFGCVTCHPTTNANHKNGTIVLNGFNGAAGTTKSNITCSAALCHADGKGNFTTSPNWYTGSIGDKCAMCHAAKPTTGAHSAHTNNGIHDGSGTITYAATVSCANCHAGTVDFDKNINYVNHANGTVNVSFVVANVTSKAQISPASFNAYSTVWTRTNGYKLGASSADVSKNLLSAANFAGSGGSCSTVACHNNGTTPTWNTTASPKISCVDCHSTL